MRHARRLPPTPGIVVVVGTDTGVGKTVISTLIMLRYAKKRLAYWKPIATGSCEDRDVDFVRRSVDRDATVLDEEYLFEPPVSPHLAARMAGKTIEARRIMTACEEHASPTRALVVEAAGGLLVPLDDAGQLQIDLLSDVRSAVYGRFGFLLVARTALGTINHTLLSLEAMAARKLGVIGVVLNGKPQEGVRDAIERFGRTRVISEVSDLAGKGCPSRRALREAANSFDRGGVLARYLHQGNSWRGCVRG